MELIYSKKEPTLLLHIIHRLADFNDERRDLVHEDEFLQVASLSLPAGKTFRAHKHNHKHLTDSTPITQESWVVIRGQVKAILYDIDNYVIAQPILKAGDCSITLMGGHTYEALTANVLVYEYKTGPYDGQINDKTFIE